MLIILNKSYSQIYLNIFKKHKQIQKNYLINHYNKLSLIKYYKLSNAYIYLFVNGNGKKFFIKYNLNYQIGNLVKIKIVSLKFINLFFF